MHFFRELLDATEVCLFLAWLIIMTLIAVFVVLHIIIHIIALHWPQVWRGVPWKSDCISVLLRRRSRGPSVR